MIKHVLAKVTEVGAVGLYRLRVRFSDGMEKEIDLEPVLNGEIFVELRDKALFDRVSVDHEVGAVCWPNGANFDPIMLCQWESVKADLLQSQAKTSSEVLDEK
jgi:hypothetical protein